MSVKIYINKNKLKKQLDLVIKQQGMSHYRKSFDEFIKILPKEYRLTLQTVKATFITFMVERFGFKTLEGEELFNLIIKEKKKPLKKIVLPKVKKSENKINKIKKIKKIKKKKYKGGFTKDQILKIKELNKNKKGKTFDRSGKVIEKVVIFQGGSPGLGKGKS